MPDADLGAQQPPQSPEEPSTQAGSESEPVNQPMFGPYRLEELIGRGGMGEIYRAYDTSRGRVVALKRLPVALAADPTFQARFRGEAALAARLHEPHVIPIHDFGEIDGQLYIDMRLVEGPDLAILLAGGGPLSAQRAVGIVTQVAAALDAAHAAGLVHRDIKPGNILVVLADSDTPNDTPSDNPRDTPSDFVYVADFGIARAVDGSNSGSLTSTGTTVGSLDYVAPERFGSDHGDRRADVYALGCVLYEALTAQRPFPVEGLPAVINAHLNTPPPAPTARRPDLPPGLDAVVARAMAKNPDDRYPTAGALAADARRALDGGIGISPWGSPGVPVTDAVSAARIAPQPAHIGRAAHVAPATGVASAAAAPVADRPARGPGKTRRRRLTVLAAIATVAVLASAVVTTQLLAATPDADQVMTEPFGSGGPNPFMPPVTTRPPVAIPPVATGGTVGGGTSGLYGGTLNNASCDSGQMVTFLQSHPDKARAWADVEGISQADIPSYVGALTPVVLRADTAVTNHGFAGGSATTLHSVLQAGTAVLVDRYGVPRARCYCGNPLTSSTPKARSNYTGERWSSFNPSNIVTVTPTPTPLTQLTLVDPVSLAVFTRPVSSNGGSDQLQNPTPTSTPEPTPTLSAEPPPPPVPSTAPESTDAGPVVGPPGPVQGLTSTPHNPSGSNHIDTTWQPPDDMHGNDLVGYRVTAHSAAGTFVQEVSSPPFIDGDLDRGCAQDLSYTVQAIGQPPGGGPQMVGEEATVQVTPLMNCTPFVKIISVTATGHDVTVVVQCSGSARAHENHGTLAVQMDDAEVWTQECTFPLGGGAAGAATYNVPISDVATGTHKVTATSTSISGTRTDGPVSVTVSEAGG